MINNFWCRLLNRIKYFNNRSLFIGIRLYGLKWKIPVINGLGYEYSFGNNTEIWVYKFLKKINEINKIDLFIDVGVNIGQTLIKIKSIEPNVEYIGFDPSIVCISYVQKLQKANNLNNVSFYPIGLSDSIGLLTLRAFGESDTRASLSNEQIGIDQATFTTIVPVFNLDYIVKSLRKGKQLILKIDVEGHELNVLEGAEALIISTNPLILFEVLPHHNNEIKIKNAKGIYNFLLSHNYSIYHLDQNTSQLNKVSNLIDNEFDYQATDFVAINKTFDVELYNNSIVE